MQVTDWMPLEVVTSTPPATRLVVDATLIVDSGSDWPFEADAIVVLAVSPAAASFHMTSKWRFAVVVWLASRVPPRTSLRRRRDVLLRGLSSVPCGRASPKRGSRACVER